MYYLLENISSLFFGYYTKNTSNKRKKLTGGPISNPKASAQQKEWSAKEEANYGIGESICKLYLR